MKLDTKKRIWELDAARGIAIICVLIFHAFYFLDHNSSLIIAWSPFWYGIKQYGGTFFVFLSGLCASLSSKNNYKRGFVVLGCGFVLTIASFAIFLSGLDNETIRIQWGVLHMIGFAMIAYGALRKLPDWIQLLLAIVIIGLGYYWLLNVRVESQWLFPLGLRPYPFYTFDCFPICPHLGWFLLGGQLGKRLYKNKESLLKWKCKDSRVAKLLCFCGRNSLIIYMLHMPLFYVIANLI